MKNILLIPVALAGLIACSSGPDLRYLDSRTSTNLEIPPDLTRTEINDKFVIPPNISSGLGETLNKIPVLAQVESLKLEGSADFYWLSVNGDTESLYQSIKSFWAAEGYALDIDEPAIGIMQTEWILKEEGASGQEQGFIAWLFSSNDLSARQDQFRTRIARDSDIDATQIYVSHHGMQYKQKPDIRKTDDADPNDWAFIAPDPELEIEMLSRLMVYLGLEQANVDEQIAKARLFAPRASIHTDNSKNETFLLVRSVQQLTWNRLLHELDRLDIEVVSSNPNNGFSGDGIVFVKTAYETQEEASGLLSIFSSSESKLGQKEVVLVVSEETHELTRISIETPDGEVEESAEGIEFLTMLFEQLK